MTAVTDALLGMLLDALDETGHGQDTAVFFFSDHGDWAGDYGLVEKWPSALDGVLTRVPSSPAFRGRRWRGGTWCGSRWRCST